MRKYRKCLIIICCWHLLSPQWTKSIKLVKKASVYDEAFHRNCIYDFKYYMGMDVAEDVPETLIGIDSQLDGKYWIS
jgi:hypothetical protein